MVVIGYAISLGHTKHYLLLQLYFVRVMVNTLCRHGNNDITWVGHAL